MSRLTRKFVAILLLLWLPLSSANALDMMVPMQAHGSCHDMAMQQHQQTGSHHGVAQHGHTCNICGVCHLACCSYLQPSALELVMLPSGSQSIAPYQVSFVSFTPALLDPPPLARS